jgi:hypothetical protein
VWILNYMCVRKFTTLYLELARLVMKTLIKLNNLFKTFQSRPDQYDKIKFMISDIYQIQYTILNPPCTYAETEFFH